MSAQHTPGRTCDACEGFCLQSLEHPVDAGVEMSIRIGQHVRHRDYKGQRVTGVVRGMWVDSEGRLEVDISLDAPIVIPARNADDREVSIWRQHVPAHELAPFDERDELIAALLGVAQRCEQRMAAEKWSTDAPREALAPEAALLLDLRAAIAKATGSVA